MLDRRQVKTDAKALLRSAKVSPLLMTLILLAIAFALDRLVSLVETGSFFSLSSVDTDALYRAMLEGDYEAVYDYAAMGTGGAAGGFLSILTSLLMAVLYGGYYIYHIGVRQGLQMPYRSLLDGLGLAGKLIWCEVLKYIKICLWSLLFVIPGIVAAYRYRFAVYNLLTDASLSAGAAIRLSCEQTKGRKGQLFALDLSFLGWDILSAVTMGILDIWLLPYRVQCDLTYFESAQRDLGRSPFGVS